MSDDVPAHDIVSSALRSAAIVGKVILMPFWSMNETNRVTARVAKTTRSFFKGKIFVWS